MVGEVDVVGVVIGGIDKVKVCCCYCGTGYCS